jgi:uncharacterized membrane protein
MDFNQFIPSTQEAHAIAAHLPVALSAIGVVGVLAAIAIPTERHTLRWAVVGLYLLLAASAYLTVQTGENARQQLSGALAPAIWEVINRHERLAERVWIFGLGTAIVMAVSIAAKGGLRTSMSLVTLLASLATVGWVGYTGHEGGTLVYHHGIGIPPDQVVEWRLHPPAQGAAAKRQLQETGRPLIPIEPIDPAVAAQVSWTRDVVPIFDEACNECHKEGKIESKLDMTTVAGLVLGGEKYGPAIIPGKPDESTTIKYVRGELQPQMPKDEFPLTKAQLHTLRMWISAGARDDSAEQPSLAPLK